MTQENKAFLLSPSNGTPSCLLVNLLCTVLFVGCKIIYTGIYFNKLIEWPTVDINPIERLQLNKNYITYTLKI